MRFAPFRAAFYLYTSGAIVAGGTTLMGQGLPREATASLLAGYLGLLALAVVEPRTRIFGDVISTVPDGIALTFDDGPHPEYTRRVMDVLESRDARGTFFMIGRKMEKHPEVVREVIARGHAVGMHGYSHDRLYAARGTGGLARDADREEKAWQEVTGQVPALFRPPIGLMYPRIAAMADDRDRTIVAWTIRPRDGLSRTPPDTVVGRVVPRLRPGSIVLLHDSSEDDSRPPAALPALPAILDAAARLGLSARTVTLPAALEPGADSDGKKLPPP